MISGTSGDTIVSKFSKTYLSLASLKITLEIANTNSTCAKHNEGLYFQIGDNFTRNAALSVNPARMS